MWVSITTNLTWTNVNSHSRLLCHRPSVYRLSCTLLRPLQFSTMFPEILYIATPSYSCSTRNQYWNIFRNCTTQVTVIKITFVRTANTQINRKRDKITTNTIQTKNHNVFGSSDTHVNCELPPSIHQSVEFTKCIKYNQFNITEWKQ